jgi:hypothetical protein
MQTLEHDHHAVKPALPCCCCDQWETEYIFIKGVCYCMTCINRIHKRIASRYRNEVLIKE